MAALASRLFLGFRKGLPVGLSACKSAGPNRLSCCSSLKPLLSSNVNSYISTFARNFTSRQMPISLEKCSTPLWIGPNAPKLLLNFQVTQFEQRRNLIKFSMRKTKRKTVKAVTRRFYRLHWGAWIRTRAGKNKHLWRKQISRKKRMRQHLFCNRQQSRLLNHMVTRYWKRRRHYPDDPYEPYHVRHGVYLSDN